MKTLKPKKLTLDKETLRDCTERDLSRVAGGLPPVTRPDLCGPTATCLCEP